MKPEGVGERGQQEENSRQVYRQASRESEETIPARSSRSHLPQDLWPRKTLNLILVEKEAIPGV